MRAHVACALVFTAGVFYFLLAALADPAPIRLLVSPAAYAFAPATIRVQVRLWPIATDRQVTVETDGQHFSRFSQWSIEGAAAPKLYPALEYRDVPAGGYRITATVGDVRKVRGTAVRTVTILGN